MEKREIAKFLSGFFTAGVFVDLAVILLASYFEYKIWPGFFDLKIWTLVLIGFLVLAITFSFLGWGVKATKRNVPLLMFIFTFFCFYAGYDILENKNINIFQSNLSVALSESNSEVINTIQNVVDGEENKNSNFSFALGGDKYDAGKIIAIDNDSNLYSVGYFQGTINLDVTGGLIEVSSVGNSLINSAIDIYVAKYSPEKKLIWSFSIGSSGKDMPIDFKMDGDGNFYLTGYFSGLADFNPDLSVENNLDAETGRDIFLAKYNNDGKFQWAKKIGNPEKIPFTDNDLRFEEPRSIAIKGDNLYLTGVFDESINLDDPNQSTENNTFSSHPKVRNVFLAKYSLDGTYLNGGVVGGAARDEASAIQINDEGDVYLTGYFIGKSNFDLKNDKNTKASIFSDDDFDIFLAKYDNDFNFIFVKQWGGEGNDMPATNGLEIDKNKDLYLSGTFSGTMTMGKNLTSHGESDVFFVKMDNLGKIIFAKSFGGVKSERSTGIKLDNLGDLYLTGSFKTISYFNTGKEAKALISISDGLSSDGFLVKYSSIGDYLWAINTGGSVSLESESQSTENLVIDKDNNPIITGYFYENINFNSTESLNLTSHGNTDVFVVKYSANGEIE